MLMYFYLTDIVFPQYNEDLIALLNAMRCIFLFIHSHSSPRITTSSNIITSSLYDTPLLVHFLFYAFSFHSLIS